MEGEDEIQREVLRQNHIQMPRGVVWHGNSHDTEQLVQAISVSCEKHEHGWCGSIPMNCPTAFCKILSDQRLLDGLLWTHHAAEAELPTDFTLLDACVYLEAEAQKL